MTSVVLLGDFPSTGLIRMTAERLPLEALSTPDAIHDLLSRISSTLGQDGSVVMLYPAWRAAEGRRMLGLIRGILTTDRVAGVSVDLPPLGLSLLADQLAHMAPYLRPGRLIGLAHRQMESMAAGAWVSSVAKLEHVDTGLGKHVASYLPGSGFAATIAPVHGVHRITSSEPVPGHGIRPLDPVLMIVADEDGDMAWLQDKLGPSLGVNSIRQVEPQPSSRQFWGAKRYVEYVAFCAHPQALEFIIRATPSWTCHWCGEATTLPVCPLCHMVQPQAAEPQQPAGPTGTVPTAAPPHADHGQPLQPPTPQATAAPPPAPQAAPQHLMPGPPPRSASPSATPSPSPSPPPSPQATGDPGPTIVPAIPLPLPPRPAAPPSQQLPVHLQPLPAPSQPQAVPPQPQPVNPPTAIAPDATTTDWYGDQPYTARFTNT